MIKYLIKRHQDILLYAIFGVLTTLINVISYYILSHILLFSVMSSTVIAWILAVLFAYVTNRKWVFHSNAKTHRDVIKELTSFFICRLATGILDWGCMFIFVDILHLNDVIIKFGANILVIILNFVASKVVIFK